MFAICLWNRSDPAFHLWRTCFSGLLCSNPDCSAEHPSSKKDFLYMHKAVWSNCLGFSQDSKILFQTLVSAGGSPTGPSGPGMPGSVQHWPAYFQNLESCCFKMELRWGPKSLVYLRRKVGPETCESMRYAVCDSFVFGGSLHLLYVG